MSVNDLTFEWFSGLPEDRFSEPGGDNVPARVSITPDEAMAFATFVLRAAGVVVS